MKKFLPILIFIVVVVAFFWQFFLKGLLPIPSDTIVGLYYPFRDAYFKTNPNGLPYKNYLITDPVRQQIPWRNLSISLEKAGELPLWNPYNFAGTPLMANLQSAAFYPSNLLFFIMPYILSWSLLIFLQPVLAGIFLFFYLKNLKVNVYSSFLGALTFSFSGFFIAWLEWGTVLNTALWLPLILLSVDKIFEIKSIRLKKPILIWSFVFVFSLCSSLLAGHAQVFFYLFVLFLFYFIARFFQYGRNIKKLGLFCVLFLLFLIITLIQWIPLFNFILLSARNVDIVNWRNPGWFIPWQNSIQFFAPDFFGNPATLNYYGVWNYAEFIGYIGIVPLVVAFFALFFRRDKKTLFFGSIFFLSLIFAFPTIFAKLPFKLDIPLLSTSQPTRLLFLTDFSLAVLASLGLDYFMRLKDKKGILYVLSFFSFIYILLWGFVLYFHGNLLTPENLTVSKSNLIFPSLIFLLAILIFTFMVFNKREKFFGKNVLKITVIILVAVTTIDLFRFGWKFEPFTPKSYLFPSTKVTNFLKEQKGFFRVISDDSKILPPNFSIMYSLQSLDGYDPLYLKRYGELMAATGRGKPDISSPFGFNRIITPQDYKSRLNNLLGAKYVLSLGELNDNNLHKVFTDGVTSIYENNAALPRAFFVLNTVVANSKQDSIGKLFDINYQLDSRAVVEGVSDSGLFSKSWSRGNVEFTTYNPNKVIIKTQNGGEGFLVLTDSFYPNWHATIDGKETKIYLTDYNFRGIIVPKGNHTIEYYISLF